MSPATMPRKTIADTVTDSALTSFFFPRVLLNLFENSFSKFTIIGFIRKAITRPHVTGLSTATTAPRKLVMALNFKIATISSTLKAMTSAA